MLWGLIVQYVAWRNFVLAQTHSVGQVHVIFIIIIFFVYKDFHDFFSPQPQEKYVTAICEQVFRKFPDFTGRCKQAAFEAMSDPMYSGKMKVRHLS